MDEQEAAASHATQEAVEHADAVIAKADDLNRRIDDKTAELIADLVSYKRRSIRTTKVMAVVVFFTLLGIGIEGYSLLKIDQNAASIRTLCEHDNATKSGLAEIFKFVQDIPPAANETSQEKQQRLDFFALVAQKTKPVDCSHPKVP